jgi:hypothetical protein
MAAALKWILHVCACVCVCVCVCVVRAENLEGHVV